LDKSVGGGEKEVVEVIGGVRENVGGSDKVEVVLVGEVEVVGRAVVVWEVVVIGQVVVVVAERK